MGKKSPISGIAVEAPLAMVPAFAQQRLLDAVSSSLPDGPDWQGSGGLSRRRLIQGSLLVAAAAGFAGVLPREQAGERLPLPAPKPFRSAIEEQREQQVAIDVVPKRKPAVPASFVDRKLALYNANTGETVTATYWSHGNYVLEELESIHWLLRDHHVDEMHAIDLKLVELLHAIGAKLEVAKPLHILSAYRTPQTNAKLAERYDGVALHSFHMEGRAVDLRVPGRRKRDILKAARAAKVGGVGNYSSYVHLDTGPRRSW